MPIEPTPRFGHGQPGERQYALVEGDLILSISGYLSSSPGDPGQGRKVLPVEYEDSEPFDPDLHYRLDPVARVDGDRVVRTYPVILKSEDRA